MRSKKLNLWDTSEKSQGNNCAMHLESICVELEQEVRIVSEECQEEIFVKAVKRKLCAGISEC